MNPSKRLYYFAFGSNILQERIEDRLGVVRKVCTYTLPDWKMVFNCGGFQSFANLIAQEGSFTEGVVYDLTDYQISRLDGYEGYPINYQKKYFLMPGGNIIFAYVCFNPRFKSSGLPALRYINIILDGCLQQDLKRTYNELVTFKNEHFKKLKGNKHKLIEL